MARTTFILGIWVLALSLGILGYQVLTLYFYRDWPAVSLGFGWQTIVNDIWQPLFGEIWQVRPGTALDALNWFGKLPLVLTGIVLSYLLFLLSDTLRGRSARRRA